MELLKILDNGVRVYWDGRIMYLVHSNETVPLPPRAQIELVQVFEEIVAKKT